MEGVKEGTSITRPPQLDGTNYPYWKAKMIAFFRSIDTKTWKAILTGWTAPTQNNTGVVIKEETDWTTVESKLSLDSKALNAIFCAVDAKVLGYFGDNL
ncbi:hypothetical protein LIER_19799 [Lithospermum erythrorhizon]|uniref:Gag-pol polyprotein n=1 Tax=Lithospermum erythrorhizon TaxID=34254 RepID=A0AAV3QJ38_LITER